MVNTVVHSLQLDCYNFYNLYTFRLQMELLNVSVTCHNFVQCQLVQLK